MDAIILCNAAIRCCQLAGERARTPLTATWLLWMERSNGPMTQSQRKTTRGYTMKFCSLLLPFAKLIQRDRLLQNKDLSLLSLLIFDEFCLFFHDSMQRWMDFQWILMSSKSLSPKCSLGPRSLEAPSWKVPSPQSRVFSHGSKWLCDRRSFILFPVHVRLLYIYI